MRVICLIPVRNEGWILGFSARAALKWCDGLAIVEHCCTDDTPEVVRDLLDEFTGRVWRSRRDNPDWDEADIRQHLLDVGRVLGGTHFGLIDADEAITGNLLPHMRTFAESLLPGQSLEIRRLNLWRSLDQYRDDASAFGQAKIPVLFRDSPDLSFQPLPGNYQIHTRSPAGAEAVPLNGVPGGLFHFQHASWPRVVAKQALYRMVEQIRWDKPTEEINRRYGPATDESGLTLADVPPSWWEPYGDRSGIRLDAEPWQAGEVRRLLELYGAERFEGLKIWPTDSQ